MDEAVLSNQYNLRKNGTKLYFSYPQAYIFCAFSIFNIYLEMCMYSVLLKHYHKN